MSLTGGSEDDHSDAQEVILDLVWGTALQNTELVDEPLLDFERPVLRFGEIRIDAKLDAVVRREDTANDCE